MERKNDKIAALIDANQEQFAISGPIENINILPIFKLLQIFKLQQYSKALTELGYGFEIYKLCMLSETNKLNLLNKLNLMPGHKARFIQLFESIWKISVKEEKSKSNHRIK